jgi:hypothetical protein
MKHLLRLLMGLVSIFAASVVWSQMVTEEVKPPKEVVEEFWKLETTGGRLTPEGWAKAAVFFVRLYPQPRKRTIAVISGKYKYSVDVRWVREGHAEIANGYVDLGRIDDTLRYTRGDTRPLKTAVLYHLVLTDKRWERGPDGLREIEVSGPLAWRIENPEPLLWLTVDTAIRYVNEQRATASDRDLRRNAEDTLAQLKKLQ